MPDYEEPNPKKQSGALGTLNPPLIPPNRDFLPVSPTLVLDIVFYKM